MGKRERVPVLKPLLYNIVQCQMLIFYCKKHERYYTCKHLFNFVGKAPPVLDEKTILLVGATGSGKSTLVDGFVNYIMGVSFDDPFRFTTIKLENEEKKTHNQVYTFILLSVYI